MVSHQNSNTWFSFVVSPKSSDIALVNSNAWDHTLRKLWPSLLLHPHRKRISDSHSNIYWLIHLDGFGHLHVAGLRGKIKIISSIVFLMLYSFGSGDESVFVEESASLDSPKPTMPIAAPHLQVKKMRIHFIRKVVSNTEGYNLTTPCW